MFRLIAREASSLKPLSLRKIVPGRDGSALLFRHPAQEERRLGGFLHKRQTNTTSKDISSVTASEAIHRPISRVPACALSTAWCIYADTGSLRWRKTDRSPHGSLARYTNCIASSMNAMHGQWTLRQERPNDGNARSLSWKR